MKKKIITNTIMFVLIIAFISAFNLLFGMANALVGVTVAMMALVLMGQDLSQRPIYNFFWLVGISLTLGVFSKLASMNMWIGIALNFITLSAIGYFLSFNFNKVLIVPFGLQYLFMLNSPVSGIDYNKRLLGLVFGAGVVMILQWVIYAKKKNIPVEKSEVLEFDETKTIYAKKKLCGKSYGVSMVRANYAIRIGLLVALTVFVTEYFHLAEGRWMTYTAFSLTELYSEQCKIRSYQRLQGTLLGAVIVLALFTIFRSNSARGIIILLAGYLNPFADNYRDSIIIVTISAVASVALTSGALLPTLERVGYVAIGMIISLLANRFILHTSLGNEASNSNT